MYALEKKYIEISNLIDFISSVNRIKIFIFPNNFDDDRVG
jgi:hypothetical protein